MVKLSDDCLQNKVVIRLAQLSDMPEISKLVDCYDGSVKIDSTKTKHSLLTILEVQGVFLGEYNGQAIGGVAGFAMPCLFDDSITFCVLFLFIKPEFRKMTTRFIKELELCLLTTKCTKITFGFPSSEFLKTALKMKRYFKTLGYKELETHFYKRF